ncbi:hypothetical protein ACELLULO517_05935 [Acidisoma cellulosilytica]|uniref:VWFD domain-containing protein n=1 Tax=Acidisoma cellulosilyticum TaxID=2802395 RepID=A0A964E2U0_9PROT|nr:hypothetical protein [Acidisoma cellulosilyticum]MCB8879766.1 hypothetical protein [Acidisoma cellulosilyticum]
MISLIWLFRFSIFIVVVFQLAYPFNIVAKAQTAVGTAGVSKIQHSDEAAAVKLGKFKTLMVHTKLPGSGCFAAHYPLTKWQKVKCVEAPNQPYPLAISKAKPAYVGNGSDWFSTVTSGVISSVTASFPTENGVTDEYGFRGANSATVYPNTYSLQINSNTFTTTACGGAMSCYGWQQFIFTNSGCVPGLQACIFMQYWLIGHGEPCPSSSWNYYPGQPGISASGCYMNSKATVVPSQPITNLNAINLIGTAQSSALDSLIMTSNNINTPLATSGPSNTLGLGQDWKSSEFNIFGDCCSSEAYFNPGVNLSVRIAETNGSTSAPQCVVTASGSTAGGGATAETNNLALGACSANGGASPNITFLETGGGHLPKGVSIGDTHLTTFARSHYDFQASGDFELLEADPDLEVQVRQQPVNPPSVSVNTEVGIKMGSARVAICENSVLLNGALTQMTDGNGIMLSGNVLVSRRGPIYTISRPSGDVVQAARAGDIINLTVNLGATNPSTIRGLLGSSVDDSHSLVMRNGHVLKTPFTYSQFQQYAESWRIDKKNSLLCDAPIGFSMPPKAINVSDLSPPEQEHARSICQQAAVSNKELLKDCILDVSLLRSNNAADVFVFAPVPKQMLAPSP